MITIPDKVDKIKGIVSAYSNPLLVKTILRLNQHFHGYCGNYNERVSFKELNQSTGVKRSELEEALNYLEKEGCISRDGEKVINSEDAYWYVRENTSDIEFFGWTKLNKKELTDILEATLPEIKYNSKKTIHISEKIEAKLLARAQKRIDQVWGEIEKDVRQIYGIGRGIQLPISYEIEIPNPITVGKGYPSFSKAVEDGAELEGKFRLDPAFSFKGKRYGLLPMGMDVCTENRKDGDYQVQNRVEWVEFQRLPIAVQEYGLEKIMAFSQRMKQVHPEKIFPESAVPVEKI